MHTYMHVSYTFLEKSYHKIVIFNQVMHQIICYGETKNNGVPGSIDTIYIKIFRVRNFCGFRR